MAEAVTPFAKNAAVAFAFILGGALGNVYDRLVHGYVIDFLDFYVNNYHWPAFNIADSAIFIGAALLIIDMFKNGDKKSEGNGADARASAATVAKPLSSIRKGYDRLIDNWC